MYYKCPMVKIQSCYLRLSQHSPSTRIYVVLVMPRSLAKCSCFAFGSALVKISARLFSVAQYCTETSLEAMCSRMKWWWISICFDRAWNCEFSVNFIAAWLSTLMRVDPLGGIPSSVSNSQIQRHSWVVLLSTMYSASIVDNATVGCFFEYQEMAPPPNMIV